jgi:hypothetical protein
MIEKEIKKNILKDWEIQFPSLSPSLPNSLFKVLSICVIGIEIMKVPRSNEYRPLFVCYPLWKENEKAIFSESFILQEIRDKKGLQFDIPYMKHKEYFEEAVKCTRNQIPIPIDKDVPLNSFIHMINYQLNNDILTKASPLMQADLYQLKLYAGLFMNNQNIINEILAEIKETMVNWAPNLFEWKYGNKENWYENLVNTIKNRSLFLSNIIQNRNLKKISRLQHSEILNG